MADHIRIDDAAPCARYLASGSQTAFTYRFPIFSAADMEVWLGSALQPDTAYTISGAGISTGGSVLFAAPPAVGAVVTLRRRIAIRRTSDFQDDGVIRAKALNDELDYQTAAIQQVADDASRAVKRSFLGAGTADLTLPEPSAGKAIKWNAAGDGLENTDADADRVLADADASAQAASTAAATATAQATAAAISAGTAQACASQAQAATSGGTIRVSATDTVGHYLCDKLTAGANIALTTSNSGGDERIVLAVNGLGSAAVLTADADGTLAANSDTCIATQKAVRAFVAANAASAADIAALQQDVIQTYLVDAITGAWAAGQYANGGYDAFNSDTIGADSTGQTYESGRYYDNPGGYGPNIASNAYAISGGTFGGGYTTANAFDGIDGDGNSSSLVWASAQTGGGCVGVAYLGQDFGSAQAIGKVRLFQSAAGGNFYTNSVVIQYSANGSSWSNAGTFAVTIGANVLTFSPVSARYWRVLCNAAPIDGNVWEIGELSLYAMSPPANMSLVSKALSPAPAAVPAQIKLMVLWKAIDAATINTDFTAEASRDGATWTLGTLVDTGLAISGYKVLWTVIDVGAQPTGTTVKYRIKTHNARTQQVKGVALMTR